MALYHFHLSKTVRMKSSLIIVTTEAVMIDKKRIGSFALITQSAAIIGYPYSANYTFVRLRTRKTDCMTRLWWVKPRNEKDVGQMLISHALGVMSFELEATIWT